MKGKGTRNAARERRLVWLVANFDKWKNVNAYNMRREDRREIVALMKRAGLFSPATAAYDVYLLWYLVTARERLGQAYT